ncbi:MAG TPA: sulfatase [Blastocatellia bacterium]|nr:sulfatase [Blastocatellia bacterium]
MNYQNRRFRLWQAVALFGLLALPALAVHNRHLLATGFASQTPATRTGQPNIIFILTDDLDADEIRYMPNLKALLADRGLTLNNYLVNVSLCCPSRTSTLRGQYAHNTQVTGNNLPDGGFEKVLQLGLEKSTVATWLQAAGYQTMLAGKYLNGYPHGADLTYVPPGWSEWYSPARGNAYGEFNYTLNENGKLVYYGNNPEDYGTDVYGRKAADFIERTAKEGKPFFAWLATYAPHGPATPAPRHAGLFPGARAPRGPSFNEADVSDKPAYIRNRPLLTAAQIARIDEAYRRRLQSLQAVDELIARLVGTLISTGQLDNTYIFFTSDNGFHLGQHRLMPGKQAPYEEDIRVSLIVRGPGVPQGRTLDHLAGNIDLAPTWAELGGAKAPDFVDGRSLLPLLGRNPTPVSAWRQAFLLQHGSQSQPPLVEIGHRGPITADSNGEGLLEPVDPQNDPALVQRPRAIPPFTGLRTQRYTYVQYATGERELYDLRSDPDQLKNIAGGADPVLLWRLARQLVELRHCAVAGCRASENGSPDP